ncbi:MAG TPA: hypothetical protein VH108_04640 [Gaiellaceae bacterium]|jgi:hypothetical protein|nr:hypothetical protein [Gaiellaceae bacterium]
MGYDKDKVDQNIKIAKEGWDKARGKTPAPKPAPPKAPDVQVNININE